MEDGLGLIISIICLIINIKFMVLILFVMEDGLGVLRG